MKVYMVSVDYGYDGGLVPMGLFSTLELATAASKTFINHSPESADIFELELDGEAGFGWFNKAKRM